MKHSDPKGDRRPVRYQVDIPDHAALSEAERAASAVNGLPLTITIPAEQIGDFFDLRKSDAIDKRVMAAVEQAADTLITKVMAQVRRIAPAASAPTTTGTVRLSVDETARVLGVTAKTVRAYIRSGELPASKVGTPGKERRYSIVRSDVDAYLAARRVKADAHDVDAEADEILRSLVGEDA